MKKTLLFLVTVFCFAGSSLAQEPAKAAKKKQATQTATQTNTLTRSSQENEKSKLEAKKKHFDALKSKKTSSSSPAAEVAN